MAPLRSGDDVCLTHAADGMRRFGTIGSAPGLPAGEDHAVLAAASVQVS